MTTRTVLSIVVLMAAGCAGEQSQPPQPTTQDFQLQTSETGGVLTGSAVIDGAKVGFTAQQLAPDQIDLAYELDGMTFTYTFDKTAGVIETDGFATATGVETQFNDADRAKLLGLSHALDLLGKDVSPLVGYTRDVASGASEWPDSVETRRETYAVQDRSWTSICWAMYTYQSTTHDCWDYNDWDDQSTIDYAWVGMNGPCPYADGTYFWTGYWNCYEPDHDPNVEYGYGNCFGRCGSGCGSSTQFTWDCLDHDDCVRTGHDTASFWCDDEFTSAADDWTFAPNC